MPNFSVRLNFTLDLRIRTLRWTLNPYMEKRIDAFKMCSYIRKTLSTGRNEIVKLKNREGQILIDRNRIISELRVYYSQPFESRTAQKLEKYLQRGT